MKLLIISGTPKTDGITHSFVKAAEETANELGVKAEVVRLSDMNLEKCKMCSDGWGICFTGHLCEFGDKDGFNALQEKVKTANAFVYLSPVYWGEVSEEMKIFVDKLRRCQATKQWDSREDEISFHKDKPSIIVAVAGGGGGGITSTFVGLERAIEHMGGDKWPRENAGIFDFIGVNRWNQSYKLETLKAAITSLVKYCIGSKPKSVTPQKDYELIITYENGEKRTFDVKPYLNKKPYDKLKDIELFNKAAISGYQIAWYPLLEIEIEPLEAGQIH
jgi:multimeric flavodoxin WrbA